jgi:glycosyltransferase involved in cell wall biosynthesis
MLFRDFDNKILTESEILSENGLNVEMIGPDSAGYKSARSALTREVRASIVQMRRRGLPIVDLPLLLGQLLLAIRGSPDICHCYGMNVILCALALKIMRRRIVYDVGDDIPSILGTIIGRRLRSKQVGRLSEAFLRAFEGVSCGQFDSIITLTDWLAYGRSNHNKNTATIGYYPHPCFNPSNLDSSLTHRYETSNLVIYDGRIVVEKGLDTMLRVADLVRQEIPEFRLLLIGEFISDSAKKKFAERLVELGLDTTVEITGWIPHYDVPRYINLGKVGLSITEDWCLSYSITESYKLLEMMACGKPVIASKTNLGGRLAIRESGGGVLADQSDVGGIADCLIRLLRNDKERELMGLRARAYIQKHRNWAEFRHRLLSVYEPYVRNDRAG